MDIKILKDRYDADWRQSHDTDVVFVMPTIDIDQAVRSAELMASRAYVSGSILIVPDPTREGFIQVANEIFRQSDSTFFGYVAQDAYAGRGWLKLACQSLINSNKGLLAFNDGKWHGILAAFGLVRRSWAVDNYDGDLFFSGYKRHWADTELTLIAKSANQLVYNPNSVLMELDWGKDVTKTNTEDSRLFKQRGKALFDGKVNHARHTVLSFNASGLP